MLTYIFIEYKIIKIVPNNSIKHLSIILMFSMTGIYIDSITWRVNIEENFELQFLYNFIFNFLMPKLFKIYLKQ